MNNDFSITRGISLMITSIDNEFGYDDEFGLSQYPAVGSCFFKNGKLRMLAHLTSKEVFLLVARITYRITCLPF